MGRLIRHVATATALAITSIGLGTAPAAADAKVSVRNSEGTAAIDPTYLTELTVSGSGFQSIENGHGGIYVLFGAVEGTWRPSKGGKSGEDYITVPDSQSKNNSGYARFVAFPGGDTADSANGGSISDDGGWSTSINVPGATFTAQNGKKVDCRTTTCGVITLGAHGVINANNETFTKVDVNDLFSNTGQDQDGDSNDDDLTTSNSNKSSAATVQPGTSAASNENGEKPARAVPAELTVDRAAARPGRILAFNAVGLKPGAAVNATFANGLAAAGPLTVNAAGEVAGLIQLPTDVTPGTYELRLVGGVGMPSTRFAVIDEPGEATWLVTWAPYAFAGAGLIALLGAVAFGFLRWRRLSHAS